MPSVNLVSAEIEVAAGLVAEVPTEEGLAGDSNIAALYIAPNDFDAVATNLYVFQQHYLNSESSDWGGVVLAPGENLCWEFTERVVLNGFALVASAALSAIYIEAYTSANVLYSQAIPNPPTYIKASDPPDSWYAPYPITSPIEGVLSLRVANNTGSAITIYNANLYTDQVEVPPALTYLNLSSGFALATTDLSWGNVIVGTTADTSFVLSSTLAGTILIELQALTSGAPDVDKHHYLSLDGVVWTSTVEVSILAFQVSTPIYVRRITPLAFATTDPWAFRVRATISGENAATFYGYYEDVLAESPRPHLWFISPNRARAADELLIYGTGMGEDRDDWASYLLVQEGMTQILAPTDDEWTYVSASDNAYLAARELNYPAVWDAEHMEIIVALPTGMSYPTSQFYVLSETP